MLSDLTATTSCTVAITSLNAPYGARRFLAYGIENIGCLFPDAS